MKVVIRSTHEGINTTFSYVTTYTPSLGHAGLPSWGPALHSCDNHYYIAIWLPSVGRAALRRQWPVNHYSFPGWRVTILQHRDSPCAPPSPWLYTCIPPIDSRAATWRYANDHFSLRYPLRSECIRLSNWHASIWRPRASQLHIRCPRNDCPETPLASTLGSSRGIAGSPGARAPRFSARGRWRCAASRDSAAGATGDSSQVPFSPQRCPPLVVNDDRRCRYSVVFSRSHWVISEWNLPSIQRDIFTVLNGK